MLSVVRRKLVLLMVRYPCTHQRGERACHTHQTIAGEVRGSEAREILHTSVAWMVMHGDDGRALIVSLSVPVDQPLPSSLSHVHQEGPQLGTKDTHLPETRRVESIVHNNFAVGCLVGDVGVPMEGAGATATCGQPIPSSQGGPQ